MEHHRMLSDDLFESLFASGKLQAKDFTHEAHLRLAFIHLKKYGRETAIQNISQQLKQFVKISGVEGKFHMTLTVAGIRAVEHFMKKSGSNNFPGFIEENSRLKSNFKELLGSHYGFNIFDSKVAKEKFVEPDLIPFDD